MSLPTLNVSQFSKACCEVCVTVTFAAILELLREQLVEIVQAEP